jgi:hypothetical protein
VKFDCSYSELLDINSSKIIPNPKNPNSHPKDQIQRLSKIIEYQGQRHPIIISKRSGFLVVGHGRLEAIKELGWEKIAVSYQDFENEAQEYSFVVSDNAIASWSELDLGKVNHEMLDLGPDFDLEFLGIENFKLDLNEFDSNNGAGFSDQEELSNYSTKVKSPVYSPKKDTPPPVAELFTIEKYESLVKEIKDKRLPKEIELFLINAASRHIVFNYENIAEFYCHQHSDIQELMEKSALVIIDFNKAVEGGFVKITEEINAIIDQNNNETEEE